MAMKNYEKIKGMDIDQLACFLAKGMFCGDLCNKLHTGCNYDCPYNHGVDVFKKWLLEEA